MFTRFAIGLLWVVSSVVQHVQAADAPFVLRGTLTHTLKSKHTGVTHELVVSLPETYQNSKTDYPVLYFLDGYWDMPLVYATYGNLRYDNAIPDIILVGLSLPDGADYGAHRTRFFSPTPAKPGDPQTGHAAALYKMLTQEAVPYIEKHYRVRSDNQFRALAGQSMGGLFALYALYQKPARFSRFIAVNPAAVWDNNSIAAIDARFAEKNKSLPARLFISYGSDEYAPFRQATVAFQKQLKARNYKGLELLTHELKGMRHTGGKGEAYARGLLWIFNDLAPKEKSGLQRDMDG